MRRRIIDVAFLAVLCAVAATALSVQQLSAQQQSACVECDPCSFPSGTEGHKTSVGSPAPYDDLGEGAHPCYPNGEDRDCDNIHGPCKCTPPGGGGGSETLNGNECDPQELLAADPDFIAGLRSAVKRGDKNLVVTMTRQLGHLASVSLNRQALQVRSRCGTLIVHYGLDKQLVVALSDEVQRRNALPIGNTVTTASRRP